MYEPGTEIANLHVESELGSGGMGVVLRVRTAQGETRALKVLTHPSRTARLRLRREAEVQQGLLHRNIVQVYEILELPPGALGVLMELVEGPTLKQWLNERPRTLAEVEPLFRQLVDAVAFAHAQGWVHRDIKPSNVLLAGPPDMLEVRLTDFGLVRAAAGDEEGLTLSGAALGTPGYMAPEQARSARQADIRADVFSLGCTLHRMVTGMEAFPPGDWLRAQTAMLEGAYIRPDEVDPALPRRVCAAVRGALLPNPDQRLPDCATLLQVLDGTLDWPASWASARAPQPGAGVHTWSDSTLEGGEEPTGQSPLGGAPSKLAPAAPEPPRVEPPAPEPPRAARHEPTAPPRRAVTPVYRGLYPEGPPPPPPAPPPPKPRRRLFLPLGVALLGIAVVGALWEGLSSPQRGADGERLARIAVSWEGPDGKICIASATEGCLQPGPLAPGTYTVWVSAPGGAGRSAGMYTLKPGQRVDLSCVAAEARCE